MCYEQPSDIQITKLAITRYTIIMITISHPKQICIIDMVWLLCIPFVNRNDIVADTNQYFSVLLGSSLFCRYNTKKCVISTWILNYKYTFIITYQFCTICIHSYMDSVYPIRRVFNSYFLFIFNFFKYHVNFVTLSKRFLNFNMHAKRFKVCKLFLIE